MFYWLQCWVILIIGVSYAMAYVQLGLRKEGLENITFALGSVRDFAVSKQNNFIFPYVRFVHLFIIWNQYLKKVLKKQEHWEISFLKTFFFYSTLVLKAFARQWGRRFHTCLLMNYMSWRLFLLLFGLERSLNYPTHPSDCM